MARNKRNSSVYGASSLDPNIPSVQRHRVKSTELDEETDMKSSKKKTDKKKKS